MHPEELDRLLTLAEIAVAMAGFSSIVVLFKRRESGTWQEADADRFNGMILHSVAAVALCLLPSVVDVFARDATQLWRIASSVLGIQVLAHAGTVAFHIRTTGPASSLVVGAGGLGVAALQTMNALGLGFEPGFGPFLIGVVWHLLHAGFLFSLLVLVPRTAIER